MAVVRSEPSLAVFPAVAGVAGVIYLIALFGGGFVVGLVGPESAVVPGPIEYVFLFVAYLGTTFVASFFTAALLYNARQVFRGRDPTLRDGLAAAWRNVGALLAWAVVSAVFSTVIRLVEDHVPKGGALVATLFGAAWGVLTYFVVPVVVFEDVSVTRMLARSGETFRETWGETVGAELGVGFITFYLVGAAVVVAFAAFHVFGAFAPPVAGVDGGFVAAVAVGVPVGLVAYLAGTTLTAVAKAALYVYATEGRQPSEFGDADFSGPAD